MQNFEGRKILAKQFTLKIGGYFGMPENAKAPKIIMRGLLLVKSNGITEYSCSAWLKKCFTIHKWTPTYLVIGYSQIDLT